MTVVAEHKKANNCIDALPEWELIGWALTLGDWLGCGVVTDHTEIGPELNSTDVLQRVSSFPLLLVYLAVSRSKIIII